MTNDPRLFGANSQGTHVDTRLDGRFFDYKLDFQRGMARIAVGSPALQRIYVALQHKYVYA